VKTAAVVFLAFLFCAIMFVGLYDLYEFRPYAGRIEAIYQCMDSEDRQPPVNVQTFIWKVDGSVVNSFVAGHLLSDFRKPMRMGAWHYHSSMWELMLRLHFDRTKQMSFYCHYLPHENGAGFAKAAQIYFGKQPHELNDDQLATLVAIGRHPSANSPTRHPESLERVKTRLLEAAKTQ
jgi:Transglycosylase